MTWQQENESAGNPDALTTELRNAVQQLETITALLEQLLSETEQIRDSDILRSGITASDPLE